MSTTKVFYPHAIIFNDAVDDIYQLDNLRPAYNDQDMTVSCASGWAPEYLGIKFASPDVAFDTAQFNAILTRVAAGGNIVADFTGGNVDFEYLAGKNLSFREAQASTVHVRGRLVNSTMLHWTSYQARMKEDASISCRIVTAWDGVSADPMVMSKGIALDAGVCDVTELYHLGVTKVNGTTLTGVQGVNWNNNVELETQSADGDIFDAYQGLRMVAPEVLITTTNLDYLADFGDRGVVLDGVNGLVTTLRRHAEATILETDATEKHVQFTALQGFARARQISDSPATVEISIRLKRHDASTFFSIDLDTAI